MITVVFTAYVGDRRQGEAVDARLRELCAVAGVDVEVTVVDVTADPSVAETNNVIGIPTVVLESPPPRRRVIGDLDDDRRVSMAFGLDRIHEREPA